MGLLALRNELAWTVLSKSASLSPRCVVVPQAGVLPVWPSHFTKPGRKLHGVTSSVRSW